MIHWLQVAAACPARTLGVLALAGALVAVAVVVGAEVVRTCLTGGDDLETETA